MQRKWFKFRDSLIMGYKCQKLAVKCTWFFTISTSVLYEPNILSNRPPAIEGLSEPKIVASNLRSMHEARKAFIKSESSEKISRAFRHNLRSYKDAIFTTGDDFYYKKNDSKRWKGPGKVIGVDGQQILVKHGSFYVTHLM